MDQWTIAMIALIVIIMGLALIVILHHHKLHALQIINTHTMGACAVYNVCLNIKINGHAETATLDTGTDFTLIPSSIASSLGLQELPTSTILGQDVPFSGIGGGQQNLHSVDVQMSIEKSRTFAAGVLLNQGDTPPVILLSLHDLYQAYRLQFIPIR